ncbi:MAG: T9SS type A sorting domain-containing protein [Chitinophagales bacterium]
MKKLIIVSLVAFLAASSLRAENWINLLTSSKITELQHKDNQLYIASWGGFFVYDLNSASLTQHVKTEGFLSNKIEDIVVLAANDIWIGTYENGVAHFDGSTWTNYLLPSLSSFNPILLYNIEYYQGALYVATSGGLLKLEEEEFEVLDQNPVWDLSIGSDDVLYTASFIPGYLSGDSVVQYEDCPVFSYGSAYVLQDQNRLYFSANGQLAIFENGLWTSQEISNGSFVNDGVEIILDKNHQLWMNYNTVGIFTLVNDSAVLVHSSSQLSANFDYSFGTALAFTDDILVIGDKNELCFIYNGNMTGLDIRKHHLVSNYIQDLDYAMGRVYLKNGSEMVQFNPNNFQASPVNALAGSSDFEAWEPVYAAYNDELAYFNKTSGQLFYKGVMQQLFDPNVLPFSYAIIDARIDKNDALWVGTYQGLYEFANGTYTKFDTSDVEFTGQYFGCIGEDKFGNIWVASNKELAMRDGNTWSNIYYAEDLNNGFGGAGLSMLFDENNTLYYSCWANGVSILENGVWTNMNTQNSGLSDNMVREILLHDDLLYFATYAGLDVFDGQDFINYNSINSGLSNDQCMSLAVDQEDNIWIGTANGISVFNKNGIVSGLSNKEKSGINIRMFPNPSSQFITLASQEAMLQVEVFDLKGNIVYQHNPANENTAKLDLSSLVSGIYFVRIKTSSSIQTQKLQISH